MTYARKPVYRVYRAGGVRHSQSDIGKAQRVLGYLPKHRVASGMAQMPWDTDTLQERAQ